MTGCISMGWMRRTALRSFQVDPDQLSATVGAEGERRPMVLGWPALVGAAGSTLVALACDLPRSPYGPQAAGVWPLAAKGPAPGWEGPSVPWWATVANRGPGVDKGHVVPAVLAVVGVALLGLGWVMLLRSLRRSGPVTAGRLWLPFVVWTAPLFLAAPFASQDVWIYGAQGKLALRGVAASQPTSVLGHSIWLAGVDPKWATRPSIYGPGALGISALFVQIGHGHPWVVAECWRLAAALSLVVCAWGVDRIVSAKGARSDMAVVGGVFNPGVLVVLVASIHNDALMVALVVVGVVLAIGGKPWWGIGLCAAAVTIKAPAVLGILGIAWWAWGDAYWRRAGRALAGTGLAVVLLLLVGIPVGGGFAWVHSASAGLLTSSFSVSGGLLGVTSAGVSDAVQVVGVLVAVTLVVRRRERSHWVGGLSVSFAAAAFLAVNPQPWYIPWILVLFCCEGVENRRQSVGIGVLVTMMAWSEMPFGTLVWFLGLVALVWVLVWSEREWSRRPTPVLTA
jgi:hypothetical protein